MKTADANATANALIAEVYRAYGSLRCLIGASNSELRLASLEVLTLGGVVEVEPEQLSVAQMAKLSGNSRQAIQRAAGALARLGLIEMAANPSHKRSPLMVATPEGRRMKAHLERARHAASRVLAQELGRERLDALMHELETVRACIDGNAVEILSRLRASASAQSSHRSSRSAPKRSPR